MPWTLSSLVSEERAPELNWPAWGHAAPLATTRSGDLGLLHTILLILSSRQSKTHCLARALLTLFLGHREMSGAPENSLKGLPMVHWPLRRLMCPWAVSVFCAPTACRREESLYCGSRSPDDPAENFYTWGVASRGSGPKGACEILKKANASS